MPTNLTCDTLNWLKMDFQRKISKMRGTDLTIYADLHNHTTASDGDFSPEELVACAREKGIQVLGITDHDTDKGLDRALKAGKIHGIKIITGIEISVRFKRPIFTGTLHLLCYFKPALLQDPTFRQTLTTTLGKGRGDGLVLSRVKQINHFFGPDGKTPILKQKLTVEDVSQLSSNISRRHFAMALNQNHGITDKEVVNRIIGNQSPAYLPSGIDLAAAKEFTQSFPVLTVLAHPAAGSFPGEGHYKEVLPPMEIVKNLLPEFLDIGIKGIEIPYPGHYQEHREILQTWTAEHSLLVTGGSDCHDAADRPLGMEGLSKKTYALFKNTLDKLP